MTDHGWGKEEAARLCFSEASEPPCWHHSWFSGAEGSLVRLHSQSLLSFLNHRTISTHGTFSAQRQELGGGLSVWSARVPGIGLGSLPVTFLIGL